MLESWKTYKLGEISRIGDGAHAKVNRIDHGVLYLTSKNFKQGKLNLDKIDYISENDYNRLFSSTSKAVNKLEAGDIILGIIGTLGNAYLYKDSDRFGISSSVAIIRPDSSKIFSKYLYYYITGSEFKHNQNAHNGASVQGYTNIPSLKVIPISFPQLSEQRTISSILSAIDDKIELNLQMNKTLEEMAMALYKHWFVDFGPFQDGEFVESELGMIPKGWEVKGILNIANLLSGGTPKTTVSEYWDGDINWVSAKDIGNGGTIYINDTEKKITEAGVKNSSTKILPVDTVILVARGSVGKFGMIAKPMAMNQSCYGLYTKSDFSQGLIYLMVSTLIDQFLRVAYGAVFDTITTTTFNSTKVISPPKEIIHQLRDLIDPLFLELKQNILENQCLTTLRDTLLPKLISGEVRVKEVTEILEEVL